MKEILKHLNQIRSLCSKYKVRTLFVFGSAATDRLGPESDIDLIIDFDEKDPMAYADNYFNFKFELEQLMQRPIDLLEQKALRNPYLKEQIDKTKVLIYGT